VPAYTGPEKPIFSSAPAILSQETTTGKTNSRRIILIIFVTLIVIVGLGLLGYFVIAPWLFPPQMPAVR
jgi:hypothetical protein